MRDYVSRNFRHVADGKGLDFNIELSPELPRHIVTDVKRLQQVVKNLLSNALKFTEKGKVSLRVDRVATGWTPGNPTLASAESVIAFSVEDTGIGIPGDKQRIIFEAFQQADGTTSRKYGGTGLGLSISREIAHLLGGEIRLQSLPGVGSTFTLFLPQTYAVPVTHRVEGRSPARTALNSADALLAAARNKPVLLAPVEQEDDRDNLQPGESPLLVIDDDPTYSRILFDAAHLRGFKVVSASRGDMGLAMARKFLPSAVLLDIGLPDTTGWSVLDQLRHDPDLQHIPVHVLSIYEDRRRGLALGAKSYFRKAEGKEVLDEVFLRVQSSIDQRTRKVLVVNADGEARPVVEDALELPNVEATYTDNAMDAVEKFQTGEFDCVVLGPAASEVSASDLVLELQKSAPDGDMPVIVFAPQNGYAHDRASRRRGKARWCGR